MVENPDWEKHPMLKVSLGQGITLPRIPSLERLAIIYENQGKIKEAIDVCNIGVKYGIIDTDYRKGGFEKRKSKLEKKLEKKG